VQAIVKEVGSIAAQEGQKKIEKEWLDHKGLQNLRDKALRVMLAPGAVASSASRTAGGLLLGGGGGSHSGEIRTGSVVDAAADKTRLEDARTESESEKEENHGDDSLTVGTETATAVAHLAGTEGNLNSDLGGSSKASAFVTNLIVATSPAAPRRSQSIGVGGSKEEGALKKKDDHENKNNLGASEKFVNENPASSGFGRNEGGGGGRGG